MRRLLLPLVLIHTFSMLYTAAAGLGAVAAANGIGIALCAVLYRHSGKRGEKSAKVGSEDSRDPLTGLYSREYIEKNIQHKFTDKDFRQNSCLAIIDIDFFKDINNTYGQSVGDEALSGLAEVIVRSFRLTDVAARWGGDEFLMILNTDSTDGAFRALESLREKLEKAEIKAGGHKLRITVTIGFTWCGDSAGFADCVTKSEHAVQEGRKSGCNRTMYYAQLPGVEAQSGLRL